MATVSFMLNPSDFRAALLGSMGLCNEFIQRQTGLTMCQVSYRLRKAGIRLADYRSGTGIAVKQVMAVQDQISDRLKQDLQKLEAHIESTFKKAQRRPRAKAGRRKVA